MQAPAVVEAPVPASDPEPSIPLAARIVSVAGSVTRESDGAMLAAGAAVYAGDRLRIAVDGGAVFRLSDDSSLALYSGADIRFHGGDHDAVEIQHGILQANIVSRAPDRWFHVQTPQAQIVVRGTSFQVDVTAARTQVQVHNGRVELATAAGTDRRILAAGQRAVIEGRTIRLPPSPQWQWRLAPATGP